MTTTETFAIETVWHGPVEDGYDFRAYFKDGGWNRAERAETAEEADAILRATYLGDDEDGVGLSWTVVNA